VANFFGMGNLIAGTVISTDPLKVGTVLGVFEAAAPAQPDFNKGDQVTVLLRPSTAQIGRGDNQLTVCVADVRFRGDHFDVSGETAGETFLRFFTSHEVLIGDSLHIHFPAESVQVLVE